MIKIFQPLILRIFTIASIFLLANCGFQPIYSDKNIEPISNIRIEPVTSDKLGNLLYNTLEEFFPPSSDPLYMLKIKSLNVNKVNKAIEQTGVVSRYDAVITGHFELSDIKSGKVIYKDTLSSVAGYNFYNQEFGAYKAEEDAKKRALFELAEKIRIKIISGKWQKIKPLE